MNKTVLAIDAGTTNVRAMIVGADGNVMGKAAIRCRLAYPAPGWVEQDPEALWKSTKLAVNRAMKRSGLAPKDISAIGITGQRSTTILWEKKTGKALGPAIIWQDQRGYQRALELMEQGFADVNPVSSASKLEELVSRVPDARRRMNHNELAWGNVDSFILFRLTGGAVHATDCSQACTTGYYTFNSQWEWNRRLIEAQNLDLSLFPQVVDTAGVIGATNPEIFGAEVPIGAIIGDQQSAGYGQGCLDPGDCKVTFGTSATCNVNTGTHYKSVAGAYPLIFWRRRDEQIYCLEGMVITAGAVFNWLMDIGLVRNYNQIFDAAASVADTHGVYFLPALQGLGSPHWQPARHGAFEGLTIGASRAHIIRAAVEGVAFRVREMLDSMYGNSGFGQPEVLRVDGGACAGDALMQVQADALGKPVERMNPLEATAFGAALLAGETCNIWEPGQSTDLRKVDRIFTPLWKEDEREEKFLAWRRALHL
jgi:glycerol kinase